MVMAVIFNSLFMAVVALMFHVSKKALGQKIGYVSLVVYWIAFEYLHFSWDLSWPWLSLGNVYANIPEIVQWYEYTGPLGGTLWFLILNIILFLILKDIIVLKTPAIKKLPAFIAYDIILIAPIVASLYIYNNYTEIESPVNIVVVQPNIDPYNEKFDGLTPDEQLEKMFSLAQKEIDEKTDYVVFPETALPQGIWENKLQESDPVQRIKIFLEKYPKLHYVTGLVSYRAYENGDILSETARPFRNGEGYYDIYNSAMQVDNSSELQIYHKSKLVPGVEKMPFPSVLGFLEDFAIDLGGMTGSHGTDKERSVFASGISGNKIAPIICYESVYNEYLTGYIGKGADLLFILTNDGWWSDTPGYKQHLNYARLRAISLRRSIARSANTGISCFINQRGDIIQPTGWWQPTVIKNTLNANTETTFYAAYGDMLARVSIMMTFLLILWTIAKKLNKSADRLKF
jgi:apolipoprotein N-acyltransferase